MKSVLIKIGEPSIWQNQMIGEYKTFKNNTYRRMVDLYNKKWYTQVNEYSNTNYRILKNEFGFEKYLTSITIVNLNMTSANFAQALLGQTYMTVINLTMPVLCVIKI